MMALKRIWDLGIFAIKKNLKIRINRPFYLNVFFGCQSVEKQKENPKNIEFYIL